MLNGLVKQKVLPQFLPGTKRYFFYPKSTQALAPMLCPIQWINTAHPPRV